MLRMRHGFRRVLLIAAAAVAALLAPGVAEAAPWCGTAATSDSPTIATGHAVRVLYLYPSDGVDRSAERAPAIWADVEEIDAWWRANDPTRTVNFDLTRFACGTQIDLVSRRMSYPSADLVPLAGRFDRFLDDVYRGARFDALFSKYLVYYDGPVDNQDTCGTGTGIPGGTGLAIVFLQACPGVRTTIVAAHELVHAYGALFRIAAPNSCPDDLGHVCDGTNDLLFPRVNEELALSSYVLDFGRNDYYGHASPWFDVQDSLWLRHLDASVRFSLVVRGRGTVRSDVPGLACSASCATDWNRDSALRLEAEPARGQRFIRWTGVCEVRTDPRCDVLIDAPMSVTAVFAPARFQLAVRLTGRGRITGGGFSCTTARCSRTLTSFRPVILRATAAKGWRLKGWTGACRGSRATCTVPMTAATSVRATFVRRS
jgi:hypothetical protein